MESTASIPPVVKSLHDLILAWVQHVDHIPRVHKHTLAARATDALLDAQQHILDGRIASKRYESIQLARARMDFARYIWRILVDIRAMPVKKMAHLSRLAVPIDKQLSGWEKSVREQFASSV